MVSVIQGNGDKREETVMVTVMFAEQLIFLKSALGNYLFPRVSLMLLL